MPNTTEVLTFITRDLLRQTKNNLQFIRNCSGEDFGAHFITPPKKGEEIKIRKRTRYSGRSGQTFTAEDYIERSVTMTVQPTSGVDVELTNRELMFRLDDIAERVVKPMAETLAHQIDRAALLIATQATANSVGTPGTIPTAIKTYNKARAKMVWESVPQDSRHTLLITPDMQVEGVEAGRPIFNPNSDISKAHRSGMLAPFYGAEVFECQGLITHQVGPQGGTPLVAGAAQSGASITTDGWTAAAALRLRKGDVITFAGAFAAQPRTGDSIGVLRQFTVTANVSSDVAGLATIPISPPIVLSGPFKNVTAAPTDNGAVTVVGAANTLSPEGFRFHREAFLFASFDQPTPTNKEFARMETDPQTGLKVRLIKDWDTRENTQILRSDVEWAFGVAFPEWACRIASGPPA